MLRYVFPLEITMGCKTIGLCLSTKFLFKIIAKSVIRRFFVKSVLKKSVIGPFERYEKVVATFR